MNILFLGGTRYFGRRAVYSLIEKGHTVTIATRGRAADDFGNRVKRLIIERTDEENMKRALRGVHYDVAFDSLAYCSSDVKYALEAVDCDRYIMVSSASVYQMHVGMKEEDFDPYQKKLIWCGRTDFSYGEIKRQAECALFQKYSCFHPVAVRFPIVIGEDDYTGRLAFHVEHIIRGRAMNIDDDGSQLAFVRSDEAGSFLAFLADCGFSGPINGCSPQTVTVREILEYVSRKTGKTAVISPEGDEAPFNGASDYSMNTEKAEKLGFHFTPLHEWIFGLLDYDIDRTIQEEK